MTANYPVAVTGMGIVCAAGADVDEFLVRLLNGYGGIGPVEGDAFDIFDARNGGQVADDVLSRKLDHLGEQATGSDRAVALAIVAADEAITRSGLDLDDLDPRRIGLVLGKCQALSQAPSVDGGAAETTIDVVNGVASYFGIEGPRVLVSTACAAGTNAIGIGRDKLRTGEADVVVVGGVDELRPSTWGGFSAMHAMSKDVCAPYSQSTGMNLGEGAAFLVLESLSSAIARGAPVHGEILGYGLSADAHHMTAPDPCGRGAIKAMERALADAGTDRSDIDYVNGHGTGTPANDRMELKIQRDFFGARQVPMSSTKSFTGHALGASGVMEAIASLLAIEHQFLPPTLRAANTEAAVDCVPGAARRPADVSVVLSNNYAFGGNNASAVFARARSTGLAPRVTRPSKAVAVTGIGVIGAPGMGIEAWLTSLASAEIALSQVPELGPDAVAAAMPSLPNRKWASPNEWRQMSRLARHTVIASRLAVDDADLPLGRDERRETGLFMGTAHGAIAAGQKLEKGDLRAVSPILMAQATPNVPAGIACQVMGLMGPTTTFVMGAVSGILALAAAIDVLDRGDAPACIVVATDELSRLRHRCARSLDLLTTAPPRPYDPAQEGMVLGESAVALVVEPLDAAVQRGAEIYAELRSVRQGSECLEGTALDPTGTRWADVVAEALAAAEVAADDVALAVGSASGARGDEVEIELFSRMFSDDMLVAAPKELTGHCAAASGLVNVALAAVALRDGRPPMAGRPLKRLLSGDRRCESTASADLTAAVALDVEFGASYTASVLTKVGAR